MPADVPAGSMPPSDTPPHRYTAPLANAIEARWQAFWEASGTFRAPNPGEAGFDPSRPKKFILDMFPYPSGVGLHVGHPLGYIATDITARYARMTGHNVLHAMGFDSFGLPAEQYAVQTNTHPRITTERNIATMRTQLARLGLGHDPARSVSTTDTAFYRWTQWIFLRLHDAWYDAALGTARPIAELTLRLEKGEEATASGRAWSTLSAAERQGEIDARRLAYQAEVDVNWCPMLGTVLANEEVTADGRSERGNHPVYKRPLRQWMMRITAYAERLLRDLDAVEWPEPIKLMQRNWIGRSEGAFVDFRAAAGTIRVFTTRPDTLFGATYVTLAPEHPLVPALTAAAWPEGTNAIWKGAFAGAPAGGYATPREAVAAYRAFAAVRGGDERSVNPDKTGVFTGSHAINPVTGAPVPVFIADYVLTGYGTGAIMAVPAHDERDFEFAAALDLPVVDVVYPRPALALQYFADNAFSMDGAPRNSWKDELADFLGLVTSNADTDEPLDVMLTIAQARRLAAPAAAKSDEEKMQPGGMGSQRGSTRAVWVEVIEEMGLNSFGDLAARFARGQHQRLSGEAYTGPGVIVNSSGPGLSIDGLRSDEGGRAVCAWLAANGLGGGAVTYKLRDWLFSRQRYWGEPFPIVYDEAGVAHALPESMLPVLLPDLADFKPEASTDPNSPPRPPLARAKAWTTVELDLGEGRRRYTRETNTMPNWAGSCWYYLRYLDPTNEHALCDPAIERYWMGGGGGLAGGVDLYVGGVEHAVLHLLYARFWHKALFDLGHVSTPEPFQKLFNQGYIQAAAYTDARGAYVEAERVEDRDGGFFFEGEPVAREFGKMGKSLKNAVAPDEIGARYGCDTLRVYEMAMGPLEASKPWNTRDIVGSHRFLQKAWRTLIDEATGASRVTDEPAERATRRVLHKTILGVRRDMEALGFNTAVSKLIELVNHIGPLAATPMEVARPLILMLAPFAPHVAEELWHRVVRLAADPGARAASITNERYPVGDGTLAADDEIEIPVSVMGKLRSRVTVPAGADAGEIERTALADPKVRELTAGKTITKVIVVPGRMVNVLIR